MVQTASLGTAPLPHHILKWHRQTVSYLMGSLGPLSRTQLLHGTAKTASLSAPLHHSAPGGGSTPTSTAPCAVLAATNLHQPRLALDLRLPERPCAKYSINYDIKSLVMTLSFFQAPVCLLHLKESRDRFSPGASPCLHSQVAALVLRSAPW